MQSANNRNMKVFELVFTLALARIQDVYCYTYSDNYDRYRYVVGLCVNHGIVNSTIKILCSGALLNQEWVLTAAHCLIPIISRVRYGDTRVAWHSARARYSNILQRHPHPQYRTHKGVDIGLIKVDPIILPFYGQVSPLSYLFLLGVPVRSVGFGLLLHLNRKETIVKGNIGPNGLELGVKQISEGVVSKCPPEYQFPEYPSSICTAAFCESGAGDKDINDGDSGGVLLYREEIVAVGGLLLGDSPEFSYTAISPYDNWREHVMTHENSDY